LDLQEFKALLLTVDSKATHSKPGGEENYTVWQEYGNNSLYAEGERAESALKVQIDRYTSIEYDPIAQSITDMLKDNDIPFDDLPGAWDSEAECWRHIWTCEVI
jgi:hypothetical protein